MPFGYIFTVEEARKMSYQQPFMDEEWFCFGQDNYGFVFWLCKEVDGRTFFNAWDHDMSDDIGEGMEITLEEFLQDIKTLNLLATEKGIIATSTDMEKIRTVAHDFYDGLSAEDMAFMGDCTLEDVISIYTEYFVACKTAEYLISDVDSEVSDADAKIIRVQEIVVSDELLAEQLLQQVNVSGANFSYYARQNSEDPNIEKTLAKSEKEEDAIYQAAFALEEGQISDIIEQDGKYYILKCIDAYDEAATLERKKKLEETIRSNALLKQYTAYADEHIVRFREPFWKEIDLTAHPESDADNFFSLFDENITF